MLKRGRPIGRKKWALCIYALQQEHLLSISEFQANSPGYIINFRLYSLTKDSCQLFQKVKLS